MLREPFPALGSILLKMIKIIVFTFKGQLSGKLQGELIAFSSLIVSVLPGGQVIVFICNILIGRKSYLISPRRTGVGGGGAGRLISTSLHMTRNHPKEFQHSGGQECHSLYSPFWELPPPHKYSIMATNQDQSHQELLGALAALVPAMSFN